MKIIRLFCLIVVGMLVETHISAQGRNGLVLWAESGYNSMMTDASNLNPKGGMSYGLGFGYELGVKNFVVHTGLGVLQAHNSMFMDNFVFSIPDIDSEGDNYIANFYFSDTKEKYTFTNLNIPLLLGFGNSKFYLVAGTKLGINILGKSNLNTAIVSTGSYPQFIEDFEEMPDHFFFSSQGNDNYKVGHKLNVSASLEAGIYLGKNTVEKPSYRLSAFFDYGLINILNGDFTGNFISDKSQNVVFQPQLNSFLLSEVFQNKSLNTLAAGLKLSIVFGIKEQADCMCDYYDNFKYRPKAKRRY